MKFLRKNIKPGVFICGATWHPSQVAEGVALDCGAGQGSLEKREAVLNKKIEAELGKAREATKKGNKTLAMTHLKRKKQLEDQLSKLSARRERGGELGDSHLLLVVCEPIPQRARLPTKPCTGRYPDRVETFRALKFQQGVHVWASRMANLLRNTRRMGGGG